MGSSQTRDQTPVPCIDRRVLNLWTSREVLCIFIVIFYLWQVTLVLHSQSWYEFFNKCIFLKKVISYIKLKLVKVVHICYKNWSSSSSVKFGKCFQKAKGVTDPRFPSHRVRTALPLYPISSSPPCVESTHQHNCDNTFSQPPVLLWLRILSYAFLLTLGSWTCPLRHS